MPVFHRASAADLTALASIVREAPLTAGETLFQESDVPAIYVLLSGRLSLTTPDAAPEEAGPGDTVGVYPTLSGAETFGSRAAVTESGTALRVDREVFFDLLTDRIELLRGLASAILHARAEAAVHA